MDKIIKSLYDRDRTIKQISDQSCETNLLVSALYKITEKQIKAERMKTVSESKVKEAAMLKMEELRSELQLLQTQEINSLNIWKDKVMQLK